MPVLLSEQEGAEAAAPKSPEGDTEAEKGRLLSLMGPGIWALGLKLGSCFQARWPSGLVAPAQCPLGHPCLPGAGSHPWKFLDR